MTSHARYVLTRRNEKLQMKTPKTQERAVVIVEIYAVADCRLPGGGARAVS